MSGLPILAVFGGAGCGALLRWVLGGWLNPVFPTVPLGTLAANLIGGLLVGLAGAFFTHNAGVAPEWRLLIRFWRWQGARAAAPRSPRRSWLWATQ